MPEVKWIKLSTNVFNDEKIKIIESMPEKDSILIIWIKLLILAGKTNEHGYIYLTESIPYTEETLAAVLNRPLNTIRLALETFLKLQMIAKDERGIQVLNFDKYQDGLEKLKELHRERQRRYRQRKKLELEPSKKDGNATCNVTDDVTRDATVTSRDALDIDIDKDIDKEKDNNISPKGDISQHKKSVDHPCPYQKIVSLYHEICTSLPKVKTLTDTRKRYLRARWKEHPGMDFWRELFEKVEASDFLTGRADYGNRKPFIANFEWIIRPNNFAKILEGIYDNRDSDPSFEAELLARANQLKRRREYESNF